MVERIAKLQVDADTAKRAVQRLIDVSKTVGNTEIPEVGQEIAKAHRERVEIEALLAAAKTELAKLGGDSEMANKALTEIKLIQDKRHDIDFRLRLRDHVAQLIEAIFIYFDGEAFFGKGIQVVLQGGRLTEFIKDFQRTKSLKQAADLRRKKDEAEFEKRKKKIRAFVVVFKNGCVKTVVVTVTPGELMTAYTTLGVATRIIRENGTVRLVKKESDGRLYLREGGLNVRREDFKSDEEYSEFLAAYDKEAQ